MDNIKSFYAVSAYTGRRVGLWGLMEPGMRTALKSRQKAILPSPVLFMVFHFSGFHFLYRPLHLRQAVLDFLAQCQLLSGRPDFPVDLGQLLIQLGLFRCDPLQGNAALLQNSAGLHVSRKLRFPSDVDVVQDILKAEDNERLYSAITKLEPRQQKLIQQVFFEERGYTDIARSEGLDESAIRHATTRALKKLKNFLEKPSESGHPVAYL